MTEGNLSVDRTSYALTVGRSAVQRRAVVVTVLDILAPVLDSAWVDEPAAVDDGQAGALLLLQRVAEAQVQEGRLPRTDEPHLGVDLDPRDPAERRLLADLAVLSAGEAYSASEDLLLAVAEGGNDIRVELTDEEYAQVRVALDAQGLSDALSPPPVPGKPSATRRP